MSEPTPAPSNAITEVGLSEFPLLRRGKVREVYDLGDRVLIIATDRISAFDVVLPNGIPGKGQVLTALSEHWFGLLGDVCLNHCVSTRAEDFPSQLAPHSERLGGRSMLCVKTEPLPVECVVRGYITGSGWKDYQRTGAVCGIQLAPGLQEAQRLEPPIFTPSTKAESGHDENISSEEMAKTIGQELAETLERVSIELYTRAAAYALERGIILADTKFEFGIDPEGRLRLIDEVLTPDSSRFWPAEQWRPGSNPPSLDKQFVRDYLAGLDWDKTPPGPELPAEVVEGTARRYQEILAILTGPARS